jgi:hypothetical protein
MLTKTKTNFEIKATPNFFYNEKAELMIYDAKDGSTMKYEKKRLRMLLAILYDDGSETEEIIEHAVFNFTVDEEVFPVIMSLEDAVKLSAFVRKYLNYSTRQLDQTRYFLISNAPFFKENYLKKTDEEATPIHLDKIKELFGVNVKIEYKQYDNINREFIKRISMEVPDINMIPPVEFQKGIRNFLHEQFYHEHKELISQKVQLEALPPPVAGENTPDKPNNNLNKPTTEQLSPPIKQILIDDTVINKLHGLLKGYFSNKEPELLRVLKGEKIEELLFFPHNQNKFVEVFRRLKYNGFLLNTDTETKDWICSTLTRKAKDIEQPQPFNNNSVWDILSKGKEPTKKQRICIADDWLPHKSYNQLLSETEREKL